VAAEDQATINQLINIAVAKKLAVLRSRRWFEARAGRGDPKQALAILARLGRGHPRVGATIWMGRIRDGIRAISPVARDPSVRSGSAQAG
jgi:hypothetical protein